MSDAEHKTATDERRQSIRFPAQVESVDLCFRTSAVVVNESHDGIALVVEGKFEVFVGQDVSIEYQGAPMDAVVRRVDEFADGETVIGLEWKSFQTD